MLADLENFRIEAIVDTRRRDENGKPVPGSGDVASCDCCGRAIEVHAHVAERKGTRRGTVGTQCCKRAKMWFCGVSPENKNWWRVKHQVVPGVRVTA